MGYLYVGSHRGRSCAQLPAWPFSELRPKIMSRRGRPGGEVGRVGVCPGDGWSWRHFLVAQPGGAEPLCECGRLARRGGRANTHTMLRDVMRVGISSAIQCRHACALTCGGSRHAVTSAPRPVGLTRAWAPADASSSSREAVHPLRCMRGRDEHHATGHGMGMQQPPRGAKRSTHAGVGVARPAGRPEGRGRSWWGGASSTPA